MNNRIKKKAEKRRREQIHKLLDLVLDINGIGKRQKKITGSQPTAFFEFVGHVGWVEADVRPCGYEDNDDGPRRHVKAHAWDLRELKEVVCEIEAQKQKPQLREQPGNPK